MIKIIDLNSTLPELDSTDFKNINLNQIFQIVQPKDLNVKSFGHHTILFALSYTKNLRGDYKIDTNGIDNFRSEINSNTEKVFVYVFDSSVGISVSEILEALNPQKGSYNFELDLLETNLTQKNLLSKISNKALDFSTFQKSINVFKSLKNSGNQNLNQYLVLQKLDEITQNLKYIREIPFYKSHQSLSYRAYKYFQFKTKQAKVFIKNIINPSKSVIGGLLNFNKGNIYKQKNTNYINTLLGENKFLLNTKNVKSELIKFKKYAAPDLSLIIPVYGKLDYVSKCLKSISDSKTKLKYEVILVDDKGPEQVKKRFSSIQNIKIVENSVNLGFTGTCNIGSSHAIGKYLCFLNSDTLITDHSLDHLINSFKLASNVGIAGSRLVYEDGTLQEAGGIIFNNGDGWNIGKNERPDDSFYKYFRDVDYTSGACLAISKEDFKKVGGFDKLFAPAYYEDTSLCLDVREKLKKRVVVNPLSTVVHVEGLTNGRNENTGIKKYQKINKERFVKKHKKSLPFYSESGENIWWERDKYHKGNVLIIDQCIPTPKQDSGSLDMDNILRTLLQQNFRPHFFALSNRGETPETYGYYEQGVHCVFGQENRDFKQFYSKYHSLFNYIIISRPNSASEVLSHIKQTSPDKKIIFYTVDLHHLRMQREAEQTNNFDLVESIQAVKKEEMQAVEKSDLAIVLSSAEKDYLLKNNLLLQDSKIDIWPLIRDLPEKNTFKKSSQKDIVFFGGFRHKPNLDAIKWLQTEIIDECIKVFKRHKKEFPGIKVYGSNPTEYISQLADEKTLKYMGFVENEEEAFNNAKISVAPLTYGAGLKGKVLSSLLYKTPVVGTSIAFEGFDEDKFLHLANMSKTDFAEKIYNAYISNSDNEIEWVKSYNKLRRNFSRESFSVKFQNSISKIFESSKLE